ncbi:MAG: hypothetical protein QOF76_1481 [Solirubrobacteraceae bacterium]|jgi:hypothetical protein|nr:hypothetical protein [Solirubrobacteraceae bacterium]
MSETPLPPQPELTRDEDEAGEFFLPHVNPGAPRPEDEREQYDEQILAALVSP